MKKGKDYELFIEKLYRELEPKAVIIQDDFILGIESKTKRQIDVSIRSKLLGKDYLTIVQAKDHSRPADVNKVGEFLSVIKDVRANKGILVCSKGFTKKAIEYGRNNGIELLTFHGAQNKNWETLLKIRVNKTVHHFQTDASSVINIADLAGKTITMDMDIFSYNKRDIFGLQEIIKDKILSKYSLKEFTKRQPIKINFEKLNLYMFMNDEFRPVQSGYVAITFVKTMRYDFLTDPDDYIVEFDHIIEATKIHKVFFSSKELNFLLDPKIVHDAKLESTIRDVDLEIVVFDLDPVDPFAKLNFHMEGVAITGDFLIRRGEIMFKNDRTQRFAEIQNKLNETVN